MVNDINAIIRATPAILYACRLEVIFDWRFARMSFSMASSSSSMTQAVPFGSPRMRWLSSALSPSVESLSSQSLFHAMLPLSSSSSSLIFGCRVLLSCVALIACKVIGSPNLDGDRLTFS